MKNESRRNLKLVALAAPTALLGLMISRVSAAPATAAQNTGPIPVTPAELLKHAAADDGTPQLHWLSNSRIIFAADSAQLRDCDPATRNPPRGSHGDPGAESASESVEDGLWIATVDVKSRKCTRIIQGEAPKPSPDGRKIAYVGGEESPSLWIADADGSHAAAIASPKITLDKSIFGGRRVRRNVYYKFAWSPDSRAIVYSYPTDVRANQGPTNVAEVWLYDLRTGTNRKTSVAYPHYYDDFSWSPDGKSIVFTVDGSHATGPNGNKRLERLLSLSVATGEARTILEVDGVQDLWPMYSPDGKWMAATYDRTNPFFFTWNIVLRSARPGHGQERELVKDILVEASDQSRVWSRDSKAIYFRALRGAFRQLYRVTLDGKVEQLTHGVGDVSAVALSPDGTALAWSFSDSSGRRQLWAANSRGTDARVIFDLNPGVERYARGEASEISWKSRDGLPIAGILIKPVGYVPGKRYPLIVEIHGGPQGGMNLNGSLVNATALERHMWAGMGFAVLAPDYRSGGVNGWSEIQRRRDEQDFMARDYDDIMSGVDAVIAAGIADPDRLAVLGHSYGALLTNWLITQTNRFKAAVSYEGLSDWALIYGVGGGDGGLGWMFKGNPWEVPENYRKNSAITFVKNVTTPTLLIAGQYGAPNCDPQVFHTALRVRGVDTQLVIYPGEGHTVMGADNPNLRDLLTRSVDWVRNHLNAGSR